jgi:hypothetical protein
MNLLRLKIYQRKVNRTCHSLFYLQGVISAKAGKAFNEYYIVIASYNILVFLIA